MFEDEDVIICRLCLSSCYCGINIFDPKGHNGLLVWRILKELLQLDVSTGDGLPGMICESCMAKVTDFKFFKAMCINSRIEFLKVMANRGLVPGDAGAGLPFPKTAMDSRPKQPKYVPDVIEIPEDRDPLEFLIDEKAMPGGKSATVKPKKSSSFAIGSFGCEDEAEEEECVVVDEADGAEEGIEEISEQSSEDDDIVIVNEDAEEKVEENGVCSEGSEVDSGGTVADPQSHAARYVCHHRYCSREFETLKGLRIHAQFAHGGEKVGEGAVWWGCPFCDHNAGDRKLLAVHMKAQHNAVDSNAKSADVGRMRNKIVKEMEPSSKEVTNVLSRIPTDGKLLECQVSLTSVDGCVMPNAKKGVKTTSVYALSSQRNSIGVEPSSSNKDDDVNLDPVNDKICNVCLGTFKDKNLLNAHVEQVHGLKKCYVCQKCSKSFRSLHQFGRHCEVHRRNKELMYWCYKCLETSSAATAMIQHVKEYHSAVKPVICKVCMCGYKSQLSLNQHTCRLFGHMSPCPKCRRVFKLRSNCKRHMKICKGLQAQKKE